MARCPDRAELGAGDRFRPRRQIRRRGDQRRRRREGPQDRDRHPRHAGRPYQGRQCDAGHDQPPEGQRYLGSDQFRRGACDHRRDGAREDAEHPPLCRRQSDRSGEVSERVSRGAVQRPVGRRGAQLLRKCSESDGRRRHWRHHRLWHLCRRRLGRGLQEGRRQRYLPDPDRCDATRRNAGHAAHEERRRQGHRGVERIDRDGSAADERARHARLGRAHCRAPRAGLGRRPAAA